MSGAATRSRLTRSSSLVMLIAAAVAHAQPVPMTGRAPRATSYTCDGLDVTVRTTQTGIELGLGDRRIALPPAPSGIADEFQEGDVAFRRHGDKADVEVAGATYSNCLYNAERSGWDDAKLRGIEFRAIGRTPAWSVEVDQEKARELTVIFADGRTVVVPASKPSVSGTRSTYKAANRDLALAIETASCRDAATSETFPEKVSLRLDGRDYAGCGRWLQRGQHGY
jgi:putative lipoprotein